MPQSRQGVHEYLAISTRFGSFLAFSTMVEKLGEITEREFRGYWDQTIADAGDTEATLHAMAAEILRYRHVGHVRLRCLLTLLSLWVGQPWANCRHTEAHPAVAAAARARRGSRTVNSVKSPTALSTVMVPPCCCVTIS